MQLLGHGHLQPHNTPWKANAGDMGLTQSGGGRVSSIMLYLLVIFCVLTILGINDDVISGVCCLIKVLSTEILMVFSVWLDLVENG